MREPYAVDGRVVIEDPHVAGFGTDQPPPAFRHFSVTLHLVVPVSVDIDEDDLEEEISYQVDRYADQAIMVDYHEE